MDAKRAENQPKKETAKKGNHHQKNQYLRANPDNKRAKNGQQKQLNPTKNGF
jgi:hypothetical protein